MQWLPGHRPRPALATWPSTAPGPSSCFGGRSGFTRSVHLSRVRGPLGSRRFLGLSGHGRLEGGRAGSSACPRPGLVCCVLVTGLRSRPFGRSHAARRPALPVGPCDVGADRGQRWGPARSPGSSSSREASLGPARPAPGLGQRPGPPRPGHRPQGAQAALPSRRPQSRPGTERALDKRLLSECKSEWDSGRRSSCRAEPSKSLRTRLGGFLLYAWRVATLWASFHARSSLRA